MTETVALRDVVEIQTGTISPSTRPLESFEYVDVAAVNNVTKVIDGVRTLLGAHAPSRARKLVRTGDVIVSTVRPNLNAVALVPEELDGQVASTGFCVLRATRRILSEYLFYYVRSHLFVESLTKLVSGAMYPAVSDSQVLNQLVPLPCLHEQRRIVNLLSRSERIVSLRRAAQKKASAVMSALFYDFFGDPGTNPKNWNMATIGDVIASADYGCNAKASEMGAGIPIIRMGNVRSDGELALDDLKYVVLSTKDAERYGLRGGDILFNRTNSKELVGKTGLWEEGVIDAIVASYFIRVRVNKEILAPSFLWAYMNTAYMKRTLFETARGAIGQANINSKELRAFRIPVPPIGLQNIFASCCREMNETKALQVAAEAKSEAIFCSMLARTFHSNSERLASK